MGHDVVAVSARPTEPPFRRKVKSLLQGRGWPIPPSTESHFDGRNVDFRIKTTPGPVTARDLPDADVVIATWWETAEWVAQLPPEKGVPVYFVQHHETVFDGQPADRVAATYRLPMRKIVCAKWLSELMRVEYRDEKAIHVPYGMDHELFQAPPRSKQKVPTACMMYSPSHFKGSDVAFRAFDRARRELPELKLVVFGEQIPRAQDGMPADATFIHRPPQKRIPRIYAESDMFLFSSRCEGFGLPVIEAMACRTPVIATPTGAGPEAVAGGGGILVRIDDPADLASAVLRIARMDESTWRGMSQAAFETARAYDWQRSAKLFESALMEIVAAAAGKRNLQ
jgi:glycosyltransferase involved in cell wall biosynthesis